MSKPRVQKSIEILDHIDPTKKVRVYRNLHKNCLSVKQGGIVKCHAENVVLKDCKFIVSEAGQRRVRNEKKKNVHAFVEGFVPAFRAGPARRSDELLDFGWSSVYYNPYETDHWQLTNEPYDAWVDTAEWVDVCSDSIMGADVLAFNVKLLEKND